MPATLSPVQSRPTADGETADGDTRHETLADLLDRLGGIPTSRVRLHPPPGTATEQDVIDADRRDGWTCELIDGTMVEKPMGLYESLIGQIVATFLAQHVYERKLGIVTGEQGPYRTVPRQIRMPDASFTSWQRVPEGFEAEFALAVSPDLAVEVLSPTNTAKEMSRKRVELFAGGTRLMWVIEPWDRTLAAHVPGRDEPTLHVVGDVVDAGDVVPGFKLDLADVFARAERPARPGT